jgi:hypothetical protein
MSYDELPTGPRLSEEQLEAIYAWVQHSGRERRRSQGAANFNEADFLAGVMVAFFALGCQDRVLGGWVFGPLGGVSMFEPREEVASDA